MTAPRPTVPSVWCRTCRALVSLGDGSMDLVDSCARCATPAPDDAVGQFWHAAGRPCPYCWNVGCTCTHVWGESCRCAANGAQPPAPPARARMAPRWRRVAWAAVLVLAAVVYLVAVFVVPAL